MGRLFERGVWKENLHFSQNKNKSKRKEWFKSESVILLTMESTPVPSLGQSTSTNALLLLHPDTLATFLLFFVVQRAFLAGQGLQGRGDKRRGFHLA